MAKEKKQYPEDFKTMFGVSTMGLAQMVGNSLITGVLMLYITDDSSDKPFENPSNPIRQPARAPAR